MFCDFRQLFQFVILSCFLQVLITEQYSEEERRQFSINPTTKEFIKDGKPFRYVSGTIHYFRVPPEYWRDRLRKLRFSGCNAVQTYVEWSSHEPEPGVYNFENGLDVIRFIEIAEEEELLVILRPGPYICAERDMGGLPYWLLRQNSKMKLRSSDPDYELFVDKWFDVLMPKLKPYLYVNGGPIIMVQIENEYGSYSACDFRHTSHLRDIIRNHLESDVQLFTTDGWLTDYLKCGKIADVYATVDFGPDVIVQKAFDSQRLFEPDGPSINSEYYPGWLDHWGEPHSKTSTKNVTTSLEEMLSMNASVNIYVFHGGTNFGLTSGANYGGKFEPCPTSYDYDAPLSEAGDPTEKYYAIRDVITKYLPAPPGPVPGPSPKYAYGLVYVTFKGGIMDMKSLESVICKWPRTFEQLSLANGVVIYSTKIPYKIPDPARLSVFGLHDRAYVYINSTLMGILSREREIFEVSVYGRPTDKLSIVVESQGRIGYGDKINELKGITSNVTIGFKELSDWTMTIVPLKTSLLDIAMDHLHQKTMGDPAKTQFGGMALYDGEFTVNDEPKDTFLKLSGWTKGYVWVNDILLGRYWPVVGPQITLYVPGVFLRTGVNKIRILELERAPCAYPSRCKVEFVDTPVIDGPTPEWT